MGKGDNQRISLGSKGCYMCVWRESIDTAKQKTGDPIELQDFRDV